MNGQKTAIERIREARLALMREPQVALLGNVGLRMELVRDDTIASMSTNGKRLRFAPKFVDGLSNAELLNVVAHEVGHPALLHNWRRNGRDKTIWNIAADLAVNWLVRGVGKAPENGAFARDFGLPNGLSADEYYDKLVEYFAPPPAPPEPESGDDGDDSSPLDDLADALDDLLGDDDDSDDDSDDSDGAGDADSDDGETSLDGDLEDAPGHGDAAGSGDGAGDGAGDADSESDSDGADAGDGSGSGSGDADGESGASDGSGDGDGGKSGNAGDDSESGSDGAESGESGALDGEDGFGTAERALRESATGADLDEPEPENGEDPGTFVRTSEFQMKQVLAQAAEDLKTIGKNAGRCSELIEKPLAGLTCWRDPLRRFARDPSKTRSSFRRPNKRHQWRGITLPSKAAGKDIRRLAVVVDASSSMSSKALAACMGECEAILASYRQAELTVVPFSDSVWLDSIFTLRASDVPLREVKITGRGGTRVSPAFHYLTSTALCKRPFRSAVVLTDGEIDDYPAKAPPFPVLWLITGDGSSRWFKRPPWGEVVFMGRQ